MHPAINREVSAGRISDFRRQARRDATARIVAMHLRATRAAPPNPVLSWTAIRLPRYFAALKAHRDPGAEEGT